MFIIIPVYTFPYRSQKCHASKISNTLFAIWILFQGYNWATSWEDLFRPYANNKGVHTPFDCDYLPFNLIWIEIEKYTQLSYAVARIAYFPAFA